MAPLGRRVLDGAARLVLSSATVSAVTDHGPLRTIELVGPDLQGQDWTPGDKIRIKLRGFELRTYTPISWDRSAGRTRLIAYAHGDGPGAAWCREAGVATPCLVRGPSHSVRLDELTTAPIFVGDETSIGLSVAWRTLGPTTPPTVELFELTDVAAIQPALDHYGLGAAVVVPRLADDGHLQHLADLVVDHVRAHPEAPVCLTGRAPTIAALRRRLKSEGLSDRSHRAKAYWDPKRSGLD
jgi:ferric-chelate reductase (NADPH)